SYLVPVSNFGTREELWDASGKVLAELSKTTLREGTGGANDTTTFAGGPGFGGRGGAQSDTAKRSVQWNPVGSGLIYMQSEAAPAGARGAGRGAQGAGRGGQQGAGAARKDRLYTWAAP